MIDDRVSSFAQNVVLVRTLACAIVLVALLPAGVVAQTLPPGWEVSDVGSPTIPGFATYVSESFTVSGAGAKGIGGTSDQFTLAHRSLTGDGVIIARVASLLNATPNAQVGIILRDSLDPRSKFAAFLLSKTNELMFKRRTSLGGSTVNTKAGPRTAPVWLKLQRQATTITASWSNDGAAWTVYGSATVPMGSVVYAGLAVTSYTDVAAAQATFTNVQIASAAQTGGPLPEGWTSQDIGGPAKAGSATYGAGTFAVTGGGSDIAGTWDQFHYAYMTADGDVDIIARLRAIGSEAAKAGLMVRDGLTPNGAHASMFYIDSQGTAFQRRPTAGGSTVTTSWTAGAAPVWLKLAVRSGVVTGYRSNDGVTWTLSGTQTLTLPSPFYIGLAVSSRDDSTAVTTNIDDVRVQVVAASPNQDPDVSLTAPADGATYTAPASITIAADAVDSDGAVARVDFYAGATLVGSDASSPYSVTWSNVPAGTYSLTAVATDDDNGRTTSAARTVTVNAPANQPPTVSLTSPANGATFTAPATIAISANAADSDGTVARVDFYQGSTLVGSDATAPYSVTWSNVPAGTYTLTARATDDDGAVRTSTAHTISVNAQANQPPSVSLAAPANGSTFTAPATITVSATAADADGTVVRVDFYQGATLIGTDTTSPYSVTWSNVGAGSYTLTARATDNAGATTTSAARTVTVTGGLPTGWTAADIGNPAIVGSTTYSDGTFTIRAGGADIWGTSDEFRYVYRSISGDFDVVARVRSVEEAHSWSKAGVMIRATLAADAANAAMLVAASKPRVFQRRTVPGGTTTATTSGQGPSWVKLARRGTTITAFTSPDGTTWTTVGTQTMTLPASFYVGVAVSSVNTSVATTAVVDSLTVAATTGNESPTVSLTAPADGATFTAPATITISANAADSDGSVSRVDFYQGSTLVGSDTAAPYSVTWSNVPAGSYTLTARATDDDGAVMTSAARTITVNAPANQPPTVSLSAPANGATFTAPATVVISANAADSDGTVARVDFYQGSTLVGSDTTAPYSVTWSNVPAGSYTLTARATDDDGAVTTSAARTITVNAPANQPPAVSLTAPANGSTYTAPATITVSATASDTDGTVVRVDFYQGSTLIGSDTASPFTITWGNVAAGTYTLTARATDDDGATITSASRSITVNPASTQRNAVFTASPDHDTLVTSYLFEVFAAGANPATATPIASQNLGKPAVVSGEITADVTATINALAPGSYQATVSAIGSGGSSRSGPATFSR